MLDDKEMLDNLDSFLEALIFSSGKSIKKSDILEKLPYDVTKRVMEESLSRLKEKYCGDSGILLLTFEDKVQFSSNPKYGQNIAEILTPLREKELSKTLLEVLSIIAYKQPITRLEIEDIRGVNSEYAISVLAKVNLIFAVGRKDTVGRPTLYGTTEEFLKKFQLENIDNLPDYNEVLAKLKLISGYDGDNGDDLYRQREVLKNDDTLPLRDIASDIIDEFMDTDEIPEFLKDDDYNIIE